MKHKKSKRRGSTSAASRKTVYVLGAGFSFPAGAPAQEGLLGRILGLRDTSTKVAKAKHRLRAFLVDDLGANAISLDELLLEDVFTPIDRCIADGISFRGKSTSELEEIRGELEYLISVAIDEAISSTNQNKKRYIQQFADYLVRSAAVRADKARGAVSAQSAKSYDPLSIISLNWDIALDARLYGSLGERDGWKGGDYDAIGVVDYCCYISSIDQNEGRVRTGLWALGCRGYNVKLLKLHGSMNWLQCSSCQRLFVGFGDKISIPNYINAAVCRHCQRYGITAMLHGALVMPTFLKDLSNFQIKLVWQNASVELMEADRLVFIGYSLPQADFEFRQLVSRMVRRDASIHVVLWRGKTAKSGRKYKEECERYRKFFSGRTLSFEPGGVQAFVSKLVRLTPHGSGRGRLKAAATAPMRRPVRTR